MEIALFDEFPENVAMRETSQMRGPDALRAEEIGKRLKALREAHDLNSAELAARLDVQRTYWSRWETGKRPIPPDIAFRLTTIFPVDLDYIYLGDLRQVPVELQTKLEEFNGQQA